MWKQRPPKGYNEALDKLYGGDDNMRRSRNPAAQGKTDANQSAIVGWYEELFCSVIDLHTLGHSIPDILVGCGMVCNELVEIKTEDGEESEGQSRFRRDWRGRKPVIVRTHADVLKHVHEMRQRLK